MFLSIIICVYKTEQYLKKCIDSITSQCFSNYEIILIDDGSPDEDKIIDTFKADNIHIFHKENTGLADSRNFGLKQAKGKYIWFVDSDDEVEPYSLEIIYQSIHRSNCDILRFNFRIINDSQVETMNSLPSKLYEGNNLKQLRHYIVRNSYTYMFSCWMHVYRRDTIQSISFVSNKNYAFDDILFNLISYQKANAIQTTNDILYRYYKRMGSITQGNKLWLNQVINAYGYIKEKYLELNIFNEYKDDLITAYLDGAVLGNGIGSGGSLNLEYIYSNNIDNTHTKIKELLMSNSFKELLKDSYGHDINKRLMSLYSYLYNFDEEGLYKLLNTNCNKGKNIEKTENVYYLIKYKFVKTQVGDDYVLVPTEENGNRKMITIGKDGNRMLECIELYKDKKTILEHLYELYKNETPEDIDACFNDFVVKLESEGIIVVQ